MSWETGLERREKPNDFIERLKEIKGDISEVKARELLGELLEYDLGFSWELLTGGAFKILPFQEILLKGWFKKDYSLVVAGRGVGKSYLLAVFCILFMIFNPGVKIVLVANNFRRCSVPDTFVKKRFSGLRRLKDISIGDSIQAIDSDRTVLDRFNNLKERTVRITTSRGFFTESLPDHQVLVWDSSNLQCVFKQMSELKIGDFIPIDYKHSHFGDSSIFDVSTLKDRQNNKENELNIEESNDFYYYLGLILGDGCLQYKKAKGSNVISSKISFGNNDEFLLDEFERISKQLIKTQSITKSINRTNCNLYSVASKRFIEFLIGAGFSNGKAVDKCIPDFVLTLNKDFQKSLLSGLFDTDGSVCVRGKSAEVKLATSSLRLAQQLQIMLLNFGIISSLYRHPAKGIMKICGVDTFGKESFSVKIYGHRNLSKFAESINFKLPRKKNKLDEYVSNINRSRIENVNLVPGAGRYFKNKYGQFVRHSDTITTERCNDFLVHKKVDNEDKVKLEKLISDSFFFDELVKIEESESETIDIKVEEEECYWGNGFIHHNCKDIFNQMEKFLNHPKCSLLRQCFESDNKSGTKVKMNRDQSGWVLKCINESTSKALPLGGGENLRGERANVLLIDEGLLVSEHIQNTILRPFLTAKLNAKEQSEMRERETQMIRAGTMKEEERAEFPNNKMIVTSSASYQFEYLYEGIFLPYLDSIRGKQNSKNTDLELELSSIPTHFVARLAYNAPPPGSIMDESVLNEAVKGKEHNPIVRREYGAEFVDASDSYFDIKKLHDCTVPSGQYPTVQLYGNKRAEYILALDPSYGTAKTSDYFAMGVYMIVPEDHRIYQVHSYGKAGSDISEHYEYLTYVLTHFNIVWFVIDGSGTEFINGYNNSVIAEKHNIKLGYISADLAADDHSDYNKAIRAAKNEWNLTTKRIVYAQPFSAPTLRTMNEYLQDGVSSSKVWFGSGIQHNESLYESIINNFKLPYPFKDDKDKTYDLVDFIDDQEDWVAQTKRQMALIEVKSIGNGNTLQYNIPSHLRKATSEKRARRDNYTCLLMAYYSSKHYFNIMKAEERPPMPTFLPVSF